ncbi:hypothetical protein H696_00844 [Fonticula alba]|uniref:Uncharacterized protein n=1 Tax=Fonticula alba TaxID=691883 RepID=A0A058ZH88_FONAL|nr:hypothetical protein H696_00844 [Fonticula alba]KCV73303.1 hypothetical protein H696_00844 [Fonticula alba]|eukprot:XP_009493004.1 hypothetical protein H696_00844 [Fonticula alba]
MDADSHTPLNQGTGSSSTPTADAASAGATAVDPSASFVSKAVNTLSTLYETGKSSSSLMKIGESLYKPLQSLVEAAAAASIEGADFPAANSSGTRTPTQSTDAPGGSGAQSQQNADTSAGETEAMSLHNAAFQHWERMRQKGFDVIAIFREALNYMQIAQNHVHQNSTWLLEQLEVARTIVTNYASQFHASLQFHERQLLSPEERQQQLLQARQYLQVQISTIYSTLFARIQSIRSDIAGTLRTVVELVSKSASALPIVSQNAVRQMIMSIPGKWAALSSAFSLEGPAQTQEYVIRVGTIVAHIAQEISRALASIAQVFEQNITRASGFLTNINRWVPGGHPGPVLLTTGAGSADAGPTCDSSGSAHHGHGGHQSQAHSACSGSATGGGGEAAGGSPTDEDLGPAVEAALGLASPTGTTDIDASTAAVLQSLLNSAAAAAAVASSQQKGAGPAGSAVASTGNGPLMTPVSVSVSVSTSPSSAGQSPDTAVMVGGGGPASVPSTPPRSHRLKGVRALLNDEAEGNSPSMAAPEAATMDVDASESAAGSPLEAEAAPAAGGAASFGVTDSSSDSEMADMSG